MQTLHFTNVYQLPAAAHVALGELCDTLVGARAINPDATCVASVTLLECNTVLRGIPSVTRNGLELFIPGCDATLRCDFTGMLNLELEVEG